MNLKPIIAIAFATLLFAGCTSTSKMMREPNVRVELERADFILSEQVTAEATSTKIIGVDWQRLFVQETGHVTGSGPVISLASIPVIGSYVSDQTANYALFNLMQANPGYDVVYYPQFETVNSRPILGIGFLTKKTTVKVTARLGKLK